jgi:hypothetical protein
VKFSVNFTSVNSTLVNNEAKPGLATGIVTIIAVMFQVELTKVHIGKGRNGQIQRAGFSYVGRVRVAGFIIALMF